MRLIAALAGCLPLLACATHRSTGASVETRTDDPSVEHGYGWRITGDSLWHSGETTGSATSSPATRTATSP